MNPEIDKLASAAIDGEATTEELARYEGDAGFLAAKSQLSAASEFVAQAPAPATPDGLAEAQISLAMDQFRADAAQRAVMAAQPVNNPEPSVVKESRWAFPRWFTPAIFSIVVLGGLGIAAQNFSNSSADEEASATTVAADGEAMMADTATRNNDADASASMEEGDEPASTPEAAEAMEDDGALDSGFEIPEPIDLNGAPFVASENLTANRVAELARSEPPIDPDLYERCGPEHGFLAPPGDLVLVVPFRLNGEAAEVLVYDTGESTGRTALIINDFCGVLSQS